MQNKQELTVGSKEERLQEELQRVRARLESQSFKDYASLYAFKHKTAAELIEERNKPYIPQCNKKLAERILEQAKSIKLFSTIKHLTANTAMPSIFDEALMGRKTLDELGIPYKTSCLGTWDIENGDEDVICFGPYLIDPLASKHQNTFEITIDFGKVSQLENCFFKQRDLGFVETNLFEFTLGDLTFCIDAIGGNRSSPFSCLTIKAKNGACAESYLPKDLLISSNTTQMNEIIVGLFFRYLDNLIVSDTLYTTKTPEKEYTDFIYSQLEKLSDKELREFLQLIGVAMVQTAEVNFYGAYQFDFSSLVSIASRKKEEWPRHGGIYAVEEFKLELSELISKSNQGEIQLLLDAKIKLPELFKSRRFTAYLLTQITHHKAKTILENEQIGCTEDLNKPLNNRGIFSQSASNQKTGTSITPKDYIYPNGPY